MQGFDDTSARAVHQATLLTSDFDFEAALHPSNSEAGCMAGIPSAWAYVSPLVGDRIISAGRA